jgi:hypothetical protein
MLTLFAVQIVPQKEEKNKVLKGLTLTEGEISRIKGAWQRHIE